MQGHGREQQSDLYGVQCASLHCLQAGPCSMQCATSELCIAATTACMPWSLRCALCMGWRWVGDVHHHPALTLRDAHPWVPHLYAVGRCFARFWVAPCPAPEPGSADPIVWVCSALQRPQLSRCAQLAMVSHCLFLFLANWNTTLSYSVSSSHSLPCCIDGTFLLGTA